MNNPQPLSAASDDELRKQILSIFQARNKFIVGQAKSVFDGLIASQKADENNIHLNRIAAKQVMQLIASHDAAKADLLRSKMLSKYPDVGITEFQVGYAKGFNDCLDQVQHIVDEVLGVFK